MNIRKFMRGIILPVNEISEVIKSSNSVPKGGCALDFGSGTLFWSEKFVSELNVDVYAVDIMYQDNKIQTDNNRIKLYTDIDSIEPDKKFDLVFACDVLHHLNNELRDKILSYFMNHSDFVVIKDIDANDKIGNFQNQMHDLIINREHVDKIYPDKLAKTFADNGFKVENKTFKRFGYPHFLLVAKKNT